MTNAENISMNDMSRKEAIELLDNLIGMIEDNHGADYDTALHMAINSLKVDEAYQLEFERTTKNDLGVDCVARQDVERFIEGFINEYTPEEELEFINLELDGLKHLPSVTSQEQKTGYWKTRPLITFCSECGFELKIDDTNYCPNCGAKMVEPQKSEEQK